MARDIGSTIALNAVSQAYGTATAAHQHDQMNAFCAMFSFTDDAPATRTFVAAAVSAGADTILSVAHGYQTGLKGTLTTTSALPGGTDNTTHYFLSVIDADNFGISDTLAHAKAGTFINLTNAGVGSHSFKPDALAGFEVHLQASLDGQTYTDIVGSTMGAVGALVQNFGPVGYNYVRGNYTCTAGQITGTVKFRSMS